MLQIEEQIQGNVDRVYIPVNTHKLNIMYLIKCDAGATETYDIPILKNLT